MPPGPSQNPPATASRGQAFLSWVILSLASSTADAFPASKEPERELNSAVSAFVEAGSYTWEEQCIPAGGRGPLRYSAVGGQTDTEGFSVIHVRGRKAVLFGEEAVIDVHGTWRHIDELSAAERQLFPVNPPMRADAIMTAMPHDVLPALVRAARFVHKDEKGLVAEIDSPRLDALPLKLLGLNPGDHVRLRLEKNSGVVARFSVEVARPTIVMNGPNPGERDVPLVTYEFELSSIGATRPNVPRNARILFVNPAAH